MTKQIRELIAVLLIGAGSLYILWGATHTKRVLGGIGAPIRDPDGKAIGIGVGLIVLAVLIVLVTMIFKPKKT